MIKFLSGLKKYFINSESNFIENNKSKLTILYGKIDSINNIESKRKKYNVLYMDIAERISYMSYASRLQVGCVLVKDDSIISHGWNGMPSGFDNKCEHVDENFNLKTKSEVLHAESNCLAKIAKSNNSAKGAVLYTTHSPCIECAKMIHQSGISQVYYRNEYRNTDGIDFLLKCNIGVDEC